MPDYSSFLQMASFEAIFFSVRLLAAAVI